MACISCSFSLLMACKRSFSIRIYWLAASVLCAMALPGPAAWGQGLFIHRDLPSAIYSDSQLFTSFRYMRHVWTTDDSVMAVVVQQGGYEGHGLVLYKTLDDGVQWTFEAELSSDVDIVSDGVIDSNNDILVVSSLVSENRTVDVNFIRLKYSSITHGWSVDPLTPVTIFSSGPKYRATRASIAVDSNGVIWCAYRLENTVSGIFQIRASYSVDNGLSWNDSGLSFATKNSLAQKCAKVLAVNSRIAMIYQDVQVVGASTVERYKFWAYREDSQPLQDIWTSQPIAKMMDTHGDPYGSHWSVAADDVENIHLSYEDGGINYIVYSGRFDLWLGPWPATASGNYSSISVAQNNDVYQFTKNRKGTKIIVRRLSSNNHKWSKWVAASSQEYDGYLRMDTPERFADHLPLLYQVNRPAPYQLLYTLLDGGPE
jgi:hypothetical protein